MSILAGKWQTSKTFRRQFAITSSLAVSASTRLSFTAEELNRYGPIKKVVFKNVCKNDLEIRPDGDTDRKIIVYANSIEEFDTSARYLDVVNTSAEFATADTVATGYFIAGVI